jgi:hypothetical protein
MLDYMDEVWRPFAVRMSVPRRVSFRLTEILHMLHDLRHPPPERRTGRIVRSPAFREALALYRLDLMARNGDPTLADAWERREDSPRRPPPRRRLSEEADAWSPPP